MSIAIMSRLFRVSFGTAARKMLAIRLADFADDEGRGIWPTVARLARETDLSVRTVQRLLKDFVDEGVLIVVAEGGNRPGQATRYDFDMQVLTRLETGEMSEKGCHGVTHVTATPMTNETAMGDIHDKKGCHHVTQTVIEPLNKPSIEREHEREGDEESISSEISPLEDRPKTAAFNKRVIRFCNGRGYSSGAWTDWDTVSIEWISKQFAALCSQDRLEAEHWRDAYLRDIASRKVKPMPVGVFLRDRAWTGLDPAVLKAAEDAKASAAKAKSDDKTALELQEPEGWAKCLGPIGMAWLFAQLHAGPADEELAAQPFLSDVMLRKAWPAVWWFKTTAQQKGGAAFTNDYHDASHLFEPVPQGSDALAMWRELFKIQGWPWLPVFDRMPVVFCPKGGADGLNSYLAAVRGEK